MTSQILAFKPTVELAHSKLVAFYSLEQVEVALVRAESTLDLDKHLLYFSYESLASALNSTTLESLLRTAPAVEDPLLAPVWFKWTHRVGRGTMTLEPKSLQQDRFSRKLTSSRRLVGRSETFYSSDWLAFALEGSALQSRFAGLFDLVCQFFADGVCDFSETPPSVCYCPMNLVSASTFDQEFAESVQEAPAVVPSFARPLVEPVTYQVDQYVKKRKRLEPLLETQQSRSKRPGLVDQGEVVATLEGKKAFWRKQIELEARAPSHQLPVGSCLYILSEALNGSNPFQTC